MRNLLVVLPGFMVALVGCTRAVDDVGNSLLAPAIFDALMAQVEKGGGCARIDQQESFKSEYFPDLTFFSGTCLDQHAQPVRATVATDSMGLIFVLGSTDGLRFMTRRHPPVGVDSAHAIEYAYHALELMGRFWPRSRLVHSEDEVSDSILQVYKTERFEIEPSRVTGGSSENFLGVLTVQSGEMIKSFEFYADQTGYFRVLDELSY